MNDFTKEELESLKWCVRQAAAHNPPQKGSTFIDSYSHLVKRLQSIIDIYCEHKWRCWDDVDNTHECMTCGEKRAGQM